MATLVFAFDLGLLSFLSWTWSVSWWKDDQLKELWWGPLKKATKKSALPPDYDLSSFFSGRWLVCWTNLDIPTCKTPNPPEKKLDIPPPPTHKVLLLQHTVFSKMPWWKDGQLVFSKMSWWKDGQLRRAMVRAPERGDEKKRASPSPWDIKFFFKEVVGMLNQLDQVGSPNL